MIYFVIHLFFTDPNGGTSVGKYPKLKEKHGLINWKINCYLK